jgi:hypothetical protein
MISFVQAIKQVLLTVKEMEGCFSWFWKNLDIAQSIISGTGISDHSGDEYLETMVNISESIVSDDAKAVAALESIKSVLTAYRAKVGKEDDDDK